jgi:hypothetical protein
MGGGDEAEVLCPWCTHEQPAAVEIDAHVKNVCPSCYRMFVTYAVLDVRTKQIKNPLAPDEEIEEARNEMV